MAGPRRETAAPVRTEQRWVPERLLSKRFNLVGISKFEANLVVEAGSVKRGLAVSGTIEAEVRWRRWQMNIEPNHPNHQL